MEPDQSKLPPDKRSWLEPPTDKPTNYGLIAAVGGLVLIAVIIYFTMYPPVLNFGELKYFSGVTTVSSLDSPTKIPSVEITPIKKHISSGIYSTPYLSGMVIQISDFPTGFSEIKSEALEPNLPFITSDDSPYVINETQGYTVSFSKMFDDGGTLDVLETLAVIPSDRSNLFIPWIIATNEKTGMVERMPDPGIGDSSVAFKINLSSSQPPSRVNTMYTIDFVKGDFAGYLIMTDTRSGDNNLSQSDYATLLSLAEKAVARIQ